MIFSAFSLSPLQTSSVIPIFLIATPSTIFRIKAGLAFISAIIFKASDPVGKTSIHKILPGRPTSSLYAKSWLPLSSVLDWNAYHNFKRGSFLPFVTASLCRIGCSPTFTFSFQQPSLTRIHPNFFFHRHLNFIIIDVLHSWDERDKLAHMCPIIFILQISIAKTEKPRISLANRDSSFLALSTLLLSSILRVRPATKHKAQHFLLPLFSALTQFLYFGSFLARSTFCASDFFSTDFTPCALCHSRKPLCFSSPRLKCSTKYFVSSICCNTFQYV